jgi:hypothetical protein
MGLRLLAIVILFLSASAALAGTDVTLFLDGALVEQEATASKGVLEIDLPAGFLANSLRVKPLGPFQVRQVQVMTRPVAKKHERELAALAERREELQDRLKALAVREDIFKAAAKSQSGKAPRRTKTNPEPLATLRQGTDFAMAQLESVYQSRRRTDRELKQLDEKLARLKNDPQVVGSRVRIRLDAPAGRVQVTYRLGNRSWTPAYDLRVTGPQSGELGIIPAGVGAALGEKIRVVLARLADIPVGERWSLGNNGQPVSVQTISLSEVAAEPGVPSPQKIALKNTTGLGLPAGEISCYREGSYLGSGSFPGAVAGAQVELLCGRW